MRSRSLALKQTLFREWHLDRLRPWVHYVPLSQEADELVEAVRFLDGDGRAEAERMAAQGRDWAARALRREDMEAWFFRLLLEYARVVDDRRASLGFDMDAAETEHGPEQQ
ncbi:hypothetical protein CDD83_878 [Cordyceps sp. RAO-2017]|nr:hypothetical protein CDD83_878 [Cordyceps sp. RAO-2017]